MKLLPGFLLVTAAFVTGCSWGNDSGGQPPSPDAPIVTQPVCGDGVCAPAESGTCTPDCGQQATCNTNGACDANETTASCPADCPQQSTCNSNGTCDANETPASCPADCNNGSASNCPSDVTACAICAFAGLSCPAGLDQAACTACLGNIGGGGSGSGFPGLGDDSACTGDTPDGTCDDNEDPLTCASDCPLI